MLNFTEDTSTDAHADITTSVTGNTEDTVVTFADIAIMVTSIMLVAITNMVIMAADTTDTSRSILITEAIITNITTMSIITVTRGTIIRDIITVTRDTIVAIRSIIIRDTTKSTITTERESSESL